MKASAFLMPAERGCNFLLDEAQYLILSGA